MNHLSKEGVTKLVIGEEHAGQRIDNFLTRHLRGVPKSHLYSILRRGEVRVNSRRIDATYRVCIGDMVRIPPVQHVQDRDLAPMISGSSPPDIAVVFEDETILVLNKPAGLAVHGGSGISLGVIEWMRVLRRESHFLELVHRLDKETSGLLLLAKKRSTLVKLHELMRKHQVEKHYVMLVHGHWPTSSQQVELPLQKYVLANGERRVAVDPHGQMTKTIFFLQRHVRQYSLLNARLITGYTHQLRVQLSHLGFPILGDDKYGNFSLNKSLQKQGLKRMFLHSAQTGFRHPLSGKWVQLNVGLPPELSRFIDRG